MNWFRNLKVGMKLTAAFAVLLALCGFLGLFSITQLAKMNGTMEDIATNAIASMRELGEMRDACNQVRRSQLVLLTLQDPALRTNELEKQSQAEELLKEHSAKYEASIDSAKEKQLYEDFQRNWADYVRKGDELSQAAKEGKKARVDAATNAASEAFHSAFEVLQQDTKLNDDGAEQSRQSAEASYRASRMWVIGILVACVGLGLIMAFSITKAIVGPVKKTVDVLESLAKGDLTQQLPLATKDEMGDMARSLNQAITAMHSTVVSIEQNSQALATASEEISSAATQTASGADSQQQQATQVATAMQEMSATVLQVSENSNKAADAARLAANTARDGGQIVEEALASMRSIADSVGNTAKKIEELGKSSKQIGEIVGVINDIADQTNLLALNAAIEAARAGEQGRGFAVVADEVRKLAERTTKATKEIAQMIQNIQAETEHAVETMEQGTKQVEKGVETTSKAGSSLHEIIKSSEQVGEMITHIATAATEQSSATEQVNGNVEQIAKITRESAAGAQQSAKACQELSGLAMDLQALVSKFKVAKEDAGSKQPRATAKRRSMRESYRESAHAHKANGHDLVREYEPEMTVTQ
jgi:methyl-accepting chemotaxis protein